MKSIFATMIIVTSLAPIANGQTSANCDFTSARLATVEGVREYRFKFSACGNCMPRLAELTVTQDERPSYADGPVKYSFAVTYGK